MEYTSGTGTLSIIKESLYLQEKHACNDLSAMYLIPPHKGTDGWVKGEVGTIKIRESAAWVLETDGESLEIDYCPWCGQHLRGTIAIRKYWVEATNTPGWEDEWAEYRGGMHKPTGLSREKRKIPE